MFKKTVVSGLIATAFAAGSAFAQTAPAAPESPHTLTGNVGLFSQYIFRGLTQTNRSAALQGGFDYAHSSGIYLGTWASNISWLKEGTSAPGAVSGQYASGGSLEMDFYGGYKANFGKTDFTYDIGLLRYQYPGNVRVGCTYGVVQCPKAHTTELYGALGWKWITLKYSHGIDNKTFGVPNSSGSNYIDLSADVPIGETGLTANLHVGRQTYKGSSAGLPLSNSSLYTYTDWKVGASYALPKDFTVGLFASGTSGAKIAGYGGTNERVFGVAGITTGPYPNNIAKTTGTVFIKKTF